MSYFEQFLPKNELDNIMLVREDKNKSAKKNILASSVESLLESYSKSAAAKAAETKTPKVTNEKKDSFLEGFNDPYGEKEDFPRQSLAQSMVRQFASPAWQTPKTPMIKTEAPKYNASYIDNFKKLYYGQETTSPVTEPQKSPSANTSEDDAFREGFNYYNDKELMFPNTELHASPSKNQSEDDAFREGFDDPYGEKKEEKEKEKKWWQTGLDWASGILTAASLVPAWDTATNALQLLVDLGREDYAGAALDAAGIIPFVGEAADFAKYGKTGKAVFDGIKAADKVADGIKAADAVSDGIRVADDVVYGAKAAATAHDAAKTRKILSEVSGYTDDVAERANLYARRVENGESLAKIFNNADDALEEMAKHAEYVSKTSPVRIPDNAEVVFDVKKNGYYQMEYRYHNSDDGYFYHSRWHTKTPGAPDYQGDSWVIERRIKGVSYGKNPVKKEHVVLLSNGQMVDWKVWQKAKTTPEQFRTPAQKMMLQLGHQTPRSR